MIICDLNVIRVAVFESKADTPLVVDPNRVLSLPIGTKLMELVPRRQPEVLQTRRDVQVLKLSARPADEILRDSLRDTGEVQLPGVPVCECFDHTEV